MSEQNSIYNSKGELVGRFRHGVAWASSGRGRLGEYDSDFVYDNQRTMIAKISNGHVYNLAGEELGHIYDKSIYVENSKVGSYIGVSEAGSAAIALIFNTGGVRGS